ncbi:hypothetical protein C1646_671196 [Rhizophagus diaphanus]|nr:hypothetical protein C1646_671196 [Rhizophagus diaphanus] [Rhizophagus sp. MUCL 43196]
MSITLLCLVKGNKTASAFAVDIDREKLVSHLKEAIKESQKPFFDSIPTKDIKLWNVKIPDDHVDPLNNLSLEDGEELLAIRKISKYFPDSPPEEHIHVLVEPPESTTISSREEELLNQVASLKALLNKSIHGT